MFTPTCSHAVRVSMMLLICSATTAVAVAVLFAHDRAITVARIKYSCSLPHHLKIHSNAFFSFMLTPNSSFVLCFGVFRLLFVCTLSSSFSIFNTNDCSGTKPTSNEQLLFINDDKKHTHFGCMHTFLSSKH